MNNVQAMALEDEITTMVLFGSIRWEMNMHRNIEYIHLNRKQHKKKRERERSRLISLVELHQP